MQIDKDALLKALAKKYIWWKSPDESVLDERRLVAQIMNIGNFEDVRTIAQAFGEKLFADALKSAEAGWFSPRSWTYWHYRCGLTPPASPPPPMPARNFTR